MTHPIEITTIMQHYNVAEYQPFTEVINGVRYWFKIMELQQLQTLFRADHSNGIKAAQTLSKTLQHTHRNVWPPKNGQTRVQ